MRKSLLLAAVLGTFALPAAVMAEDAATVVDATAAPITATTADTAPSSDTKAAPIAAPATPAAPVLNGPGMNFPLALSANPINFDAGPIGKVYVSGAVSALGLVQNNATAPFLDFFHKNSTGDFSNAQIMLQKIDGPVQFFIRAGGYSLPALGVPYLKAAKATEHTYGVIPEAYVKIAPNDTFSILAGKLPTLFGAEYTFTFQNTNIERGLLWNQENAVTRGVQANYVKGPLTASVSIADGFYSKDYTWLTGLVSYTINDSNSISVVAGGNWDKSKAFNAYQTPIAQNNGQIYNIIYKYTKGPLTLQPYLQVTNIPAEPSLGWTKDARTYGGALLANYAVTDTVNIGGRAEYIASSGSLTNGAPNLLGYGAGSDAYSLTITPTYQNKGFFLRGELSYVKVNNFDKAGALGFGKAGTDSNQARFLAETGFLF